jgi:C1A family cysteine protease
MEARTISRYGWHAAPHDHRDLLADPSGIKVLAEVDPRADMPPIYTQGQLGSCSAQGAKRVMDYDRIVNGEEIHDWSREALYYFARLLEGQPLDQDTGATGPDAFKAARRFGVPNETQWPYEDSTTFANYAVDPRSKLPESAFRRLERPYKRVEPTVNGFKAVLSNKQTIAFGFTIYESFESPQLTKDGLMPMPEPGERVLGGHETCAVGYLKDMPHHLLCANSFGPSWGQGGYFLMPWSYVLSRNASDFITVYRPA